MSDSAFLAGYDATRAVPGPLFTYAAYFGAVVNTSPHGVTGAALGLIGIFLPGVLVLMALCLSGTCSGDAPERKR